LESSPGVEAVVAPLCSTSPQYRFCFTYGPGGNDPSTLENMIRDIQRKRAAAKAEQAAYSSTGCARTEGIKAVVRSGGSGRITRALVRSAEDDTSTAVSKKGDEKVVAADRSLVQSKYRKMKSIPIENRLVARRSHIHGWGLFTKLDIPKNDPVAEYMGEIIRQRIADKREKAYELSGEGSCFMFRLDMNRIIDATQIGCMARFMNHSCQPNAYAKILSIDTDLGQERKIVVFALRDIAAGEEVTYDYKFPVEDGSLRCSCGAPNCIGRLN
jgi:[histone H3]-lysine4 N-trimethyltransferase SETD1